MIEIERHVKQVAPDYEPVRRSEVWTVEQLRLYFEKFFVYRRDFVRISDFFPYKSPKDMVSLYYSVKKHFNLSAKEKVVRECYDNKS